MPLDRADRNRFATLAKLQRLRLAHDEIALRDARTALREAECDAQAAHRAAIAREEELAGLLAGGNFAAERYCLQAELLTIEEVFAKDAKARMDAAALAERAQTQSWHASRHQYEQLLDARRAVDRRLARKAEERALASRPIAIDVTEARR